MSTAARAADESARLPGHIAFIMDGNGRWAEKRGLARLEGHKAGLENTRAVVRHLSRHQIKFVTLYSFSTENWSRPRDEIDGLLGMLEKSLRKDYKELKETNVRLRHIGRLEKLPRGLKLAIKKGLRETRDNSGMTLTLAFDYGGRMEIVDAVRRIVADGHPPREIDEALFSRYLYTTELPDVDLVIRTSGEYRISNFLLWQSAYSEYYFTDVLWPDFNETEVDKALAVYSQRLRRFGGLSPNKPC
ncbi:MAG: polyprenyl diphosphate synthase [Dehalococcoidales bacterium]